MRRFRLEVGYDEKGELFSYTCTMHRRIGSTRRCPPNIYRSAFGRPNRWKMRTSHAAAQIDDPGGRATPSALPKIYDEDRGPHDRGGSRHHAKPPRVRARTRLRLLLRLMKQLNNEWTRRGHRRKTTRSPRGRRPSICCLLSARIRFVVHLGPAQDRRYARRGRTRIILEC